MPDYCDVALPVPLDLNFTYGLNGMEPVVGGRVLVPFREHRLSGIVVALHDRKPSVATKNVLSVVDPAPVLGPELMKLGRWIADYYLAPLGEVFRAMLPLAAEFRRVIAYRITDKGLAALHTSAEQGSSRRYRRTLDDLIKEYEVLNHLVDGEMARESTLRSATKVTRTLLQGMVRKKWIERTDLSAARDARRVVRYAVLRQVSEKLNANQRTIMETLAAAGGKLAVEQVGELDVPRTTLSTLVKRGVVALVEEAAAFHVSGLKPRVNLELDFTAPQRAALHAIQAAAAAGKFSVSLLHGVTGSGKTAVYLAAMQAVLASGRSSILLVPEIGLTPAVAADLKHAFGDEVAILHSALSDDERSEQWHRIRRGAARVVVGTRSAVFAPVPDLALLVVDEEHDSSYKQEETPRYHARDVAVMRAKMAGAAVVLGSATPSLESYYNAQKGKYGLLALSGRVSERALPEIEIVDMRLEFQEAQAQHAISRVLAAEISARLALHEQVLVLLNRRGYSAFVLCRECGKTVECKNCAIAMTHHKKSHRLECHYCGSRQAVPQRCPECHGEYLYFLGTGSEKLEEQLHSMFPQARIARLDRDTVRGRHDFERVLHALHAGELDLVVGTQMIAKGHDIQGVTLVGVVGADAALSFPDFRAAERTFQLLTQVAGRAGRGRTPGKVILQTLFPDHYAVQLAARHDFEAFYQKELQFRSWMKYPPFSALANVLVRSDRLEEALRISGELGRWLEKHPVKEIRVLGPAAAPLSRLKSEYRYHFVFKSGSREKLNGLLRTMLEYAGSRKIPRTQLIVDVDALSLL